MRWLPLSIPATRPNASNASQALTGRTKLNDFWATFGELAMRKNRVILSTSIHQLPRNLQARYHVGLRGFRLKIMRPFEALFKNQPNK